MSLTVYNTLSGKIEQFETIVPGEVRMYVCGPTVYDNSHIGHAMSALVYDIVRRYLEFRGYKVIHAQNFTDIDDKIIRRAAEMGVPWQPMTEKYINQFLEWMDALNVKRATIYPRATNELGNILAAIQTLIEKGFAYTASNGDVYYRVKAKPEYGELKHQSLDDLMVGARIAPDEAKENALDFALWKAAKPGEPSWESPWGAGRPGWHIECTAMAVEHLGEQIDIHGGGADLIFPHHENEIAQSEAATGKRPFVRYWMHNGLLQMGSDKMSKSLGNFVTVGNILENYDADTLRAFILGSVYRNPLSFSEESFIAAQRGLERLKAVFSSVEKWGEPGNTEGNPAATSTLHAAIEQARAGFIEAMDSDFNSAIALAALYDLTRELNREREHGASPQSLHEARALLLELGNVLGLRLDRDTSPKRGLEAAPFISLLVETRTALKSAKQYQLADQIRDKLKALGVKVEDRPDGTSWKFES
ncbi:cysteine--tRNA ligase [Candidatus Chlorohelix sp.]|uniref:cysteine--tRNA ligase n=1 Tax=Candidatus Chlorohelix sp. TaxID=3139201 RepID=UPI003068BCA2